MSAIKGSGTAADPWRVKLDYYADVNNNGTYDSAVDIKIIEIASYVDGNKYVKRDRKVTTPATAGARYRMYDVRDVAFREDTDAGYGSYSTSGVGSMTAGNGSQVTSNVNVLGVSTSPVTGSVGTFIGLHEVSAWSSWQVSYWYDPWDPYLTSPPDDNGIFGFDAGGRGNLLTNNIIGYNDDIGLAAQYADVTGAATTYITVLDIVTDLEEFCDASVDTDKDGVPDYLDLDSDNDGINDILEAGLTDTNGDGMVDTQGTTATTPLPDADNNGTPDFRQPNSTPTNPNADGFETGLDFDGDGIIYDSTNQYDCASKTFGDSLVCSDTDGDGVIDNIDNDDDNDGILDTVENAACSPASDTCDSDGDGVYNRLDIDSDNDGIPDNFEAQATNAYIYPAVTTVEDTDLNNANLGVPTNYLGGLTPVNSDSTAATGSDTIPDYLDSDSDADGIADVAENGPQPNTSVTTDGDSDGLLDGFDSITVDATNKYGSPTNVTDGLDANDLIAAYSDTDGDLVNSNGSDAVVLKQDLDFRDAEHKVDLMVAKTDGSNTYVPGGAATYTITVTNNGPSGVIGAVINDALPTGVTLSAQWSCAVTTAGTGAITTTCPTTNPSAAGDTSVNLAVNLANNSVITLTLPVTFPAIP